MMPFAVNVKIRVIPKSCRLCEITIGIINRAIIANSPQPGPTESGSGNAQYTPDAAIMATKAGQRGSRTIFLAGMEMGP